MPKIKIKIQNPIEMKRLISHDKNSLEYAGCMESSPNFGGSHFQTANLFTREY